MTITTTNALSFKESLKENKDLFYGSFVKAYLGDIENLLSSGYPVGTNALSSITIIPFSYDETIDIESKLLENQIIYLPGTSNDRVTLQNGTASQTFTFDANGNPSNAFVGQLYTVGDTRFRVDSVGGLLLTTLSLTAETYSVVESTTSANEGDIVTFTINTTNISDGTDLYWSLGVVSGSVTTADFADPTSGTVTINNNTASVSITITQDATTEGSEEFVFQLRTNSISGTIVANSSNITINDTSLTPVYTASVSPSSVNEGESVTVTVNTQNVPDGTYLYYSTIYSGYVDTTPTSGNFLINNDTGSFTINVNRDLEVESTETIQVRITTQNGILVAQTSFDIINVSYTIAATASSSLIVESATLTVTVITTDVPDGTTVVVAPTKAYDVSPTSQYVTINNNTGTTSDFTIVRDGLTEGPEIFKFHINTVNGSKIAETQEITIVDSSYTGKNFSNKTFGPISVNRDNGNTSATSDWYTICGLDKIPDGSEIALFIDGSGSMTQATVQASYDLLLQKLQSRNITISTVTNTAEDWITPFDTNTI